MHVTPTASGNPLVEATEVSLCKKINDQKDVLHFKTASPAYKNIVFFVDILCEKIKGKSFESICHDNDSECDIFRKCKEFLSVLGKHCDEIDLDKSRGSGTLRFGHVAYRDWFDIMWNECKKFTKELVGPKDERYVQELFTYLSESFGNKMRIDYGTGHELNFLIFLMGLCNLTVLDTQADGSEENLIVTQTKLRKFVDSHCWAILELFSTSYLDLCRQVQKKFRLEPAGSRGVYNMDDYQFLPFLFGAAQLVGAKYISLKDFYLPEQVDQYKKGYMFFEAVDFILNNKRGPFNEHSYTLWGFTNLSTWDNVYRRIKVKFIEDILAPFPIVQHFLFGRFILRWN